MSRVIFKIYRGSPGHQYFEEFELERRPFLNVISALMEIQKYPVNRQGEKTTPVVWESGCLEEVCGSCSMLINGFPRQACTALVESLIEKTGSSVITLAPFTKFPLIRDLVVDRSVMFENLKKVKAFVDLDKVDKEAPPPPILPEMQETMYQLSKCMTCGCCVEACPQSNNKSKFVGAQIMAQVRLFNMHPEGRHDKSERLRTLMEEGGINDCGNAQNCVKVCPKNIPLTESIASIGRDVTLQSFKSIFGFDVKN
jgi:succinate dehydrogenase / fumarate reductase iron-sulfur subunit